MLQRIISIINNLSKETEQMEILELKIRDKKLSGWIQQQNEKVREKELEDRAIEITQPKEQREINQRKINSLRNLWDHTKDLTFKSSVLKREEKMGCKNTQRNNGENFPNLARDVSLQIQEAN